MEYVIASGIFGVVVIVVVCLLRDRSFRLRAGPVEIEAQEHPKRKRVPHATNDEG